jgi:hypothetical protein
LLVITVDRACSKHAYIKDDLVPLMTLMIPQTSCL